MNSEVARILAEEGVTQLAQPLDPSVCALMSFDHWDPADIFGPNPSLFVTELDDYEMAQQLVAIKDLDELCTVGDEDAA